MRHVIARLAIAMFVLALTTGVRAGDPLIEMLDPYFRIQAVLSDDKTDGVKTDASLIAKQARALGEAGTPIAQAADELSAAADLAAARAAFSKLSDTVIAYSQSTKPAGNDVHTMYCPMAKKQWLQKGEKVRNPYYGKSMLTCGEKKKST